MVGVGLMEILKQKLLTRCEEVYVCEESSATEREKGEKERERERRERGERLRGVKGEEGREGWSEAETKTEKEASEGERHRQ